MDAAIPRRTPRELHAADYYHKVSQAFAVFLPVKSVGVTYDISSKPPATIEWE